MDEILSALSYLSGALKSESITEGAFYMDTGRYLLSAYLGKYDIGKEKYKEFAEFVVSLNLFTRGDVSAEHVIKKYNDIYYGG